MNLKPGYIKTDAGVIPDEWEAKPLGLVGDVRMCKRVLKHQTKAHGDVPFYKIGTFGSVPDAYISNQLYEEFKRKYSFPNKGDILISAAGTIGRTVRYDGQPAYFQDSNIVWIENNESLVSNDFLWFQYQVAKWSSSHGGTVARLYNDNIRTKVFVAIPPPSEQRAIAEALRDVDELIGSLERLIAKKRDIKQAAMQQLLTGKTRLPGFDGPWEEKTLGNICTIKMGRTPSRSIAKFWGSDFVWLSIADLKSRVVSSSKERITSAGAASMEIIPKGTLLMSFKLSIGRLCFAGCDLYTNEAICSFNGLRANANFLFYALSRVDFSLYGKQAVKGYTLNKESLGSVRVVLPSNAEQTAIAQVLTELDHELDALEARLAKTRDIKQGMMQQLLTGKVRLV